ncbi:MAG: phenylalanine--tRNA ligase subunit beta [Planctomycetota bacterium]|nr:phenylalanine--tRNA ligase subunit beta [Planctomycetota bacterium]
MKVSLNWLTDYVDVSAMPAGELADVFTRIGLCCESAEETDTDIVLDLEVTSNRPDCLGHIGVAREAAAALGLELKLPDLSAVSVGSTGVEKLTSVEVLAPDMCPRYTARIIRGVKVGPSPSWMVERLEAVGLRGINNVVDVTNYVLMEFGQPLHAFDQNRLSGGRIIVRRGLPGEQIVSIDGTRCTLTEEMLVIADADKPVAVAGIMGGLESEVGDDTTDILMESARFDPLTIRKAARALSLMSESSYRFERGVDPVAVETASLRACQLLLQTAGGEPACGVIDVWADPYRPPKVTLRTDRCRSLLGVEVNDAAQAEILNRLGLSAELKSGRIVCRIPAWRADLRREIDLIEEVARLHGYDKIPVHNEVTHPVTGASESESLRQGVRDILSAAGFDEAITYTFTDDEAAALFGFQTGLHVDAAVRRTNNMLRPTLLGSLLRACKTNQDVGNEDVNLYELAAVFPPAVRRDERPADSGDLPEEYTALGMVTQRNISDLRGALEAVISLSAPAAKLEVLAGPVAGLSEGQAAEIHLDGRRIGLIGMVADAALDYFGLEKPHAAAMINFDMLMDYAGAERTYGPLPKFPAVVRDLSLVVDEAVTWRELAGAIDSTDQPMRESLRYVGTYHGRQIQSGKKSVTVSLTYRSDDGTLRSDQVDEMVGQVIEALAGQLGAELRS